MPLPADRGYAVRGTHERSTTVGRLHAAMNAREIDGFVACFADDYDSLQPAHPDRAFRGREQVRANWSAVFTGVPDFRADLIRIDAVGETVWSEWRWGGHADRRRAPRHGWCDRPRRAR
jgi:hypothetical protein